MGIETSDGRGKQMWIPNAFCIRLSSYLFCYIYFNVCHWHLAILRRFLKNLLLSFVCLKTLEVSLLLAI